jgi:hypothetical protein
VWVSNPVGDEQPSLGHNNPYLTPAENQVIVLSDLLATESFRRTVVEKAGLVESGASADVAQAAADELEVWAESSGVNLVTILGRANSAKDAQAVVAATIGAYSERGIEEIARDAEVSATYYAQQLQVAQKTLDTRKAALADVFGTLLAATFAYFSYRTDHTIRTAADLKGLSVPVLGSVPDLRQSNGFLRHTPIGWFVAWRNRDFARRTAASISENDRRPASEGVS